MNRQRHGSRALVLCVLALVSGCGSQLGMGRARTLDQGKLIVGASGELDVASAGRGEDQTVPVPWAQIGLGAHYGVHDRVELGGRVWGFGFPNLAATFGGAIDAKLGVYKPLASESKWAVAPALSLGYQQILYADAPQHVFGGTVPVLFGYALGKHELVFGPRVGTFVSTSYGQETVVTVWPGANVGFAIATSDRFELFPELVLLYSPIQLNGESEADDRTGVGVLQLGLGANFKL